MTKFLRINGNYYTLDNQYAIVKTFDNKWDIYRATEQFKGYYIITYKYLKDAKLYIAQRYI